MHGQCSITKFGCTHTRNANINGHCLHVQAVPRYAVAVRSKIFIAPWRPVTAHDINLRVRTSQCDRQIVKQIEDTRIVLVNVASAMIAQVMIDERQRLGIISIPVPIDDFEPFPSVGVKEMKTIWDFRRRSICCRRAKTAERNKYQETT